MADATTEKSNLEIEALWNGRNGTATLTVKTGGEVLTVEKLDLTKPKAREKFIADLVKDRPGIDAEAVRQKLVNLVAEYVEQIAQAGQPAAVPAGELDLTHLVRPELFFTPGVSGLAVPIMGAIGGKPVGRWVLLIQWADGKREQIDLPAKLALPDNDCLWVYPVPSEPTPATARTLARWSPASRQGWLGSVKSPNPADLFKGLCERIAHFIDLPPEHAAGTTATLAVWVILSYVYPAFDAIPYLFIGGPLGSGKSRVFEILARLVFRALSSSSMTGPALFRTLHDRGGVLLLDEAERLRQNTPETAELLSMLLAGYKRGGQAIRLESVGDTFKTVAFDVFGPKALACIAGLPPALASRSISITMFRAGPDSAKPRRRIDADPAGWQALRDDLHALALSNGPAWLDLARRVDVCPKMSGRDFELWQPMLALAEWIEESGAAGLLRMMQAHAKATIDANTDDKTPEHDEVLLCILAENVLGGGRPSAKTILAIAKEQEQDLFNKWTSQGVGRALNRYGFKAVKAHGQRTYRVELESLRRVERNYGLDLDLPQPQENVPQRPPALEEQGGKP